MPTTCRADVEALLRAKKLNRTLVPVTKGSGIAVAAETMTTGFIKLDQQLGGGLPLGQFSDVVGPRSSGRTSLLMAMLAAAGVRLDRLLWVRGDTSTAAFPPPTAGRRQPGADRAIERALKATNLILQSGGMSLVALDLADAPIHALRRIPMTTWLRLQKVLEGQPAAAVVTGTMPMSRSAGGVTLALTRGSGLGTRDSQESRRDSGFGVRDSGSETRTSAFKGPLFPGIESEVRIQRARMVPGMGAPVRLTATALVA